MVLQSRLIISPIRSGEDTIVYLGNFKFTELSNCEIKSQSLSGHTSGGTCQYSRPRILVVPGVSFPSLSTSQRVRVWTFPECQTDRQTNLR